MTKIEDDAEELRLLRNVFSYSSDLVKARYDAQFCEACNGIDALELLHEDAVNELEVWYHDTGRELT